MCKTDLCNFMGCLNCVRYAIITLISDKAMTNTGTEIPIKGTHFGLISPDGSSVQTQLVMASSGAAELWGWLHWDLQNHPERNHMPKFASVQVGEKHRGEGIQQVMIIKSSENCSLAFCFGACTCLFIWKVKS